MSLFAAPANIDRAPVRSWCLAAIAAALADVLIFVILDRAGLSLEPAQALAFAAAL